MHEEWVSIDGGLRLHLLRWDADGDRRPFVLVHGLASNAWLWAGVGYELERRGHRAVAVDLRGHGRSAKPGAGYDTARAADDLAALIGALGIDGPVVAGQSWGGNVAVALAARHQGTVAGLACVDGGWIEPSVRFTDWSACAQHLAPPALAGTSAGEIEARLRAMHPSWPDAAIAATMANFEIREDGTVAPWLTRDRHMHILRDLWDVHPPALYPEVRVPVLLLPVRHDGAATDEVAKAEALLPVARTVWLDGDHDVHAQKPAEVAGLMAGACDDGFFAP